MQMIDNMLNKGLDKLTFKERQVIVDYFRMLVKKEFEEFKTKLIANYDKEKIFERAYLIDTYDNIKNRLCGIGIFSIVDLLKYQKDNFIDYMYNKDVTDGVFDYYDTIEEEIIKECANLRKQNESDFKQKVA